MAWINFPFDLVEPEVSDRFPQQRWFLINGARSLAGGVTVYRSARSDVIELGLRADGDQVSVSAFQNLTARDCRDLAAMLLSAAHDVDAHPPSQLMAEIACAQAAGVSA